MLSRMFAVATSVAHALLPIGQVQAASAHVLQLEKSVPMLQHAYQYPRPIHGFPMVNSHQVALRRPSHSASLSVAEEELLCQQAVSDLHIDACDDLGGWDLGAGTLYWCLAPPGQMLPDTVSTHALQARDLAVFPPIQHPRGVRAGVLRPGWLCMLFTDTSRCPHGGICSMEHGHASPSLRLPGLISGKAVSYPLKRVAALLAGCSKDPSICHKMLASERDSRLRNRMMSAAHL